MARRAPDQSLILLVEDEALQRKHIEEILVAAGYRVVVARHGTEAIGVLNARNDIAAVVTDIRMPGALDGFVVAWRASRQPRPIPVIVLSAFVRAGHDETSADFCYLTKPFNPEVLVQEVEHAVAKNKAGDPR